MPFRAFVALLLLGHAAGQFEAIQRIKDAIQGNVDPENADVCYKNSYGRGVGKPLHACPENHDKSAALCYERCKPGYKAVGPVCWKSCRNGYTDTGALCTRPAKTIKANNHKCKWFDKCGLTLDKHCSKCPEHDPPYHNDGCTCRINPSTYAKKSYGRGAGKPMTCSSDEDEQAGLCYKPCRPGFKGVGPVCWKHCPKRLPTDDGAVCCTSQEECTNFIKKVSLDSIKTAGSAVKTGISGGIGGVVDTAETALETAGDFAHMTCDKLEKGLEHLQQQ